MNRAARPVVLAALAAMLWGTGGCAYFNTFYNARQKYREALDIKRKADPERPKITTQEENLYKEAFDRAARVVKYWPDSKWVDDALLLMGKASLEKGDYSTALRKFDELLTIFPDSPLAEEARLLKGRTLILTKDFPSAVVELNLASQGGGERLRPDVLYHLGLVEREEGNVDEALAAFAEIVSRYRGSEWFALSGLAAGDLERDRGNLAPAADFYEKVRRNGHTVEERYLGGMRKGDALVSLGELGRARTTFRDVAKSVANEERRGKALLAEAKSVAAEGDTAGAVKLYREILTTYPRKEAAADAQFEIAALKDASGDLEGAKEQYELVKEQGTGHPAWQKASTRATEIEQVLALREEVASGGPDRDRSRYLLAEQLLEKIGDVGGALAEYSALADEAKGTEWGAKALYAKAWVLENRLDRPTAADSVLFRLANGYAGTEVDAFARRRLGYPVWRVEKIEPPKITFIRDGATGEAPADVVLERVEPRAVPLPPGVGEVTVWVRVGLAMDGSVEETKVVKSGGDEFDEAALAASRASRFLPPDEGGPVITVVQYIFPPPAAPGSTPATGEEGGAPASGNAANTSPPNASPTTSPGTSPTTSPPGGAPPPSVEGAPRGMAPPPPGAPADSVTLGEPGDFTPPDSTGQNAPPVPPEPPSIRDRRLDSNP